MSPIGNISVAIIFLSTILSGILQAERLRNDPEFGSGFCAFIFAINALLACIVAANIVFAVRKLKSEKP